jgi:RecJ-like exonuclease
MKRITCPWCRGTGRVPHGESRSRCDHCGGEGYWLDGQDGERIEGIDEPEELYWPESIRWEDEA